MLIKKPDQKFLIRWTICMETNYFSVSSKSPLILT